MKMLDDGQTWLGNLIDGDATTPEVKVTLERKGDRVTLKVPWNLSDATGVYGRWFMSGIIFQDDPDRTKFQYEVPSELRFRGHDGCVDLLGCHETRMTSDGISGVGELEADFVVFDPLRRSEPFSSVEGLRSSVSYLREWLNVSSINRARVGGLPEFKLKAPAAIDIPLVPGLSFVPHWRVSESGDETRLHDELYVQTLLADGSTWEDHLAIHRGIRELLVVSQWWRESITDLMASRSDASQSEPVWGAVLTGRVDLEVAQVRKRRQNLIEYSDIGVDGIGRWYALRREFARAIDPIVSSRFLTDATAETQMSQVGIGLEALGYLLAQRDHRKSESAANNLTYKKRFKLIGDVVAEVVPFDTDAWALEAADSYNAIKHANWSLPELADLANTWRESVLVFRCWVATELGVDPNALKARVQRDSMIHPYY